MLRNIRIFPQEVKIQNDSLTETKTNVSFYTAEIEDIKDVPEKSLMLPILKKALADAEEKVTAEEGKNKIDDAFFYDDTAQELCRPLADKEFQEKQQSPSDFSVLISTGITISGGRLRKSLHTSLATPSSSCTSQQVRSDFSMPGRMAVLAPSMSRPMEYILQ